MFREDLPRHNNNTSKMVSLCVAHAYNDFKMMTKLLTKTFQ